MDIGIKLIKLSKRLHVDISSIVAFCDRIGRPIASDPSTKIDEDTHILILKEFSKPKNSSFTDTLIQESHKQNSNDEETFSPLELSKQYHKEVEIIEEISVED
jgi:predicted phosphoribosyltransferase